MGVALNYFDFEQGTQEWLDCRKGMPTASMFHAIMSKGRGSAPSLTRQTYMYKLAGEILTGEVTESFETGATKRGHAMEIKARALYELRTGDAVEQTGFYSTGKMGCSLDGEVGDKGIIEVKSKAPHILIPLLLENEVPNEHIAQIQGQLLITGREWCDFIAYYTGMPMMVKRVYRDIAYCRKLNSEIIKFNHELSQLIKTLEVM